MKRDDRIESQKRLEHIVAAIENIENFVHGYNGKSFCSDTMLNNAVLFQFTVIGEAIAHVENEVLEKYHYPWYKVRSFRNLIAHEYFNVKLEAVWKIIKTDLPGLKQAINNILNNEF